MSPTRKRYRGSYMGYKSSFDAKGVFDLCLYRTTSRGNDDHLFIEVEIDRSSIRCIYRAMQQFADAERTDIKELPL